MITFHEIKGIMQKMAMSSVHITRLNELIPQVVLLSERIGSLNEDLTLRRDHMIAKIKAVETLGEILKTHVYEDQAIAGSNLACGELDRVKLESVNDESGASMAIADDQNHRTKENTRRRGCSPRRDKTPRAL